MAANTHKTQGPGPRNRMATPSPPPPPQPGTPPAPPPAPPPPRQGPSTMVLALLKPGRLLGPGFFVRYEDVRITVAGRSCDTGSDEVHFVTRARSSCSPPAAVLRVRQGILGPATTTTTHKTRSLQNSPFVQAKLNTISHQNSSKLSMTGFEPATVGSEVRRAIRCATYPLISTVAEFE